MVLTQRQLLEKNATWQGDSVALKLLPGGSEFTYEALNRRVNKLATALHDRGVRESDRVGMVLYNTVEFPLTLFAAYKLGAVPVPMNHMLATKDFAYILGDVGPKVLVYDESVAESVETAVDDLSPSVHLVPTADTETAAATEPFEAVWQSGRPGAPPELSENPGALSHILYTSGTTGRPKGVAFTRETAAARIQQGFENMHMDRNSVALQLSPWFHAGGLGTTLHPTLGIGGTLLVTEDWSPEAVVEAVRAEGVTHAVSVPTVLKRISELDASSPSDFETVEFWMSQGAPLSKALTHQIRERVTENLYLGYGTTETLYDTQRLPEDLPEHVDTIGKPVSSKHLRVIEIDDDRSVPPSDTVEPGEKGEVIVKGAANLDYYYGNPEATAEAIRDGWFYTEDFGTMTEEGYLKVTGRVDDMILSGGELVSPVEVEEALEGHPEVEAAVVVGKPDEEWGERVTAVIVGDVTADELEDYCKSSDDLADYKRPREYAFVDHIERTATGKKQRFQYRE